MAKIELRNLGKTNIRVTPIGFGAMELSGGGGLFGRMFPLLSTEEKNSIIRAALDGGINWFDSAEMYGNGVSEHSVAEGLKAAGKADKDVVVETKWMPILRPARTIKTTVDDRLHYLDGYSIGIFLVHNPMGLSSKEAEMDAMADLVEAGKIKSVGISNFNEALMRRAYAELQKRGLPLAVNQMHYSLLHRDIEINGVLQAAKELGVTIVAYTPLARGLLSGKYHRNPELLKGKRRINANDLERTRQLIDAMQAMANHHKVTVAQVALNWTINFNGETVVAIPGATKVSQAAESAGAMKFRLTDAEMAELDELSRKLN